MVAVSVRICLLGPVAVLGDDGQQVDVGGPRARALLARLAMDPGRIVGLDSLMTQMAKCCKPAPPDAIRGFVTRGKGVSVHRANCSNFREMASKAPERLIDVEWGIPKSGAATVYPVAL